MFIQWRPGGEGRAAVPPSRPYPDSPRVRQTPCRAARTFPLAVLEPACMHTQERKLSITL